MRRILLDLVASTPLAVQRALGPLIAIGKRSHREEIDIRHAGLLVSMRINDEKIFPLRKDVEKMPLYKLQYALNGYIRNKLTTMIPPVRVGKSSIPDAGQGVFATSEIAPGDVVTTYPGHVFIPAEVLKMSQTKNNDYHTVFLDHGLWCVQLYDGTVIDPRWSSNTSEWDDAKAIRAGCVGHFINHPPKSTRPNVIKMAFEYTSGDEETPKSHCNTYTPPTSTREDDDGNRSSMFSSSTTSAPPHKGLAFLATRTIPINTEILVNYRFNPQVPAPSWYHPVDAEANWERWANT